MHFRARPQPVQAVQWTGTKFSHVPDWLSQAINKAPGTRGAAVRLGDDVYIETAMGTQKASPGDWIVRSQLGQMYACSSESFHAAFESAEDMQRLNDAPILDETAGERDKLLMIALWMAGGNNVHRIDKAAIDRYTAAHDGQPTLYLHGHPAAISIGIVTPTKAAQLAELHKANQAKEGQA